MHTTYTQHMENALFESWEFDASEGDYCNVIAFLNAEFGTFGDALTRFIEKVKPQDDLRSPKEYLQHCCTQTGVQPATSVTLNNWFSAGKRPKKGKDSRRAMFKTAFALGLSPEQTAELFHKVYLDRAFDQRDFEELIYYYCLQHGYPFAHAERLTARINPQDLATDDKTVYTSAIQQDLISLQDDEALIAYIQSHGHNLSLHSQNAKEVAAYQKEKARKYVQEQAEKDAYTSGENLHFGKNMNSDAFLYETIINQSITGRKGTVTVPFKDTILPKEIKTNFPQAVTFSKEDPSYEELRKLIILLFSYWFWMEARNNDIDDYYDDYADQLNLLLNEAGFAPLYYGNPFDWLFLYCTYAEADSLDTFQGLLAHVLGEEF